MQDAQKQDLPEYCPTHGWACSESCDSQSYSLVRQCDVAGLLHCHSSYAGGAHDLPCILDAAKALGLSYVGVTDIARTRGHREGLTGEAFEAQRDEIRRLNATADQCVLLHGIEIETAIDGSLPQDDLALESFDYVVATLRDHGDLDPAAQTDRAVRAVMNPFVSILGHPFGEWMTSGERLPLDLDVVLRAAAEAKVAVEIDANPGHEDLEWSHCYRAQQLGVQMVVASDAHRAARLGDYRHGVELTRQAGLCCRQILNTRSLDDLRAFFRRS